MNKNVLMIVSFVCNDDITVDVVFNDGTRQHIDIGAFVRKHPHPQYDKYLDLPCLGNASFNTATSHGATTLSFISKTCTTTPSSHKIFKS